MKTKAISSLMKDVEFQNDYPADQMFSFEKMPKDVKILASVNGSPIQIVMMDGQEIMIPVYGWIKVK